MKVVGDRLRSCPKNVCTVNNFDKTKDKVLEGKNVVALIVSIKLFFLITPLMMHYYMPKLLFMCS